VPTCLVAVIAALSLTTPNGASGPRDGDAISEQALRSHVEILSSDAFGGRGTSEWGGWLTQWHVARHFESLGLEPLPGRDGWFVDVTLWRRGVDAEGTTLEVGGRTFRAGEDFRPFPFSGEGTVEAEVVFAGYGIRSEEHEWDDYADLDVEGKVVFVLRHEPHETDPNSSFDGTESTRHAQFTVKAEVAKERGALGMILVTDPLHHEGSDDLRLGGRFQLDPPEDAEPGEEDRFLAVQVGRRAAEALVGRPSEGLADLQRAIDAGRQPAELGVEPVRARLTVALEGRARPVRDRNVAALLRGRDPRVADEWIVIGGHHDHLGRFEGDGDTVFNGADDNASGTAGVLELARSFAQAPRRPRRSIAFVTFAAEEQGLLGSRALVEQELIPVDQVVYMLNLDMIGRNADEPVSLYGDGFVAGLGEIVEQANAGVGLQLDLGGERYMGRSDHDPFYRRDVPFSFFFTGTHEDYHQLGDHPEKIDFGRARDIVQVARGMVERVAEADRAPRFIHHVEWLGARVRVESRASGEAAVVTAVEEGSRGAQAGLEPGDVITGVGGEPLEAADRVGAAFRGVEPGSTARIALARGGEALALEVERARPGWIGIWPGPVEDDARSELGLAEGEGFVVRRAVEDGPAARGGVKDGDVVLALGGQSVAPDSLRRVLGRLGAGETVDVLAVRDGERIALQVTLGERPRRGR
jgi:hypothetical protein